MPEMRVCVGCGALVDLDVYTNGRCPKCNVRHAPIVREQKRRGPEAEARRRAKPSAKLYQSRAWKLVRRAVLERDGYICQICRKAEADTVDHIVPLNKGGAALDMNNLRAACRPCNGRKGDS